MDRPGSEAVGIGAEAYGKLSEIFACAEHWRPTLEALRAALRVVLKFLFPTKLSKSENAADFSPQKADQNMKQVGWQESYLCDMQASCIEYNA